MPGMAFRVAQYLVGDGTVSVGLLKSVLALNTLTERLGIFANLQQCGAVISTFYDNEQSPYREQGKRYSAMVHKAATDAGQKAYDPNEQSFLRVFVECVDGLSPLEMAQMGNAQSAQHATQSGVADLQPLIKFWTLFKSWWSVCDKSRAWVFPFWYAVTHIAGTGNSLPQIIFIRKTDAAGRTFSGPGQMFEKGMLIDIFANSNFIALSVHDVPIDWREGAGTRYKPLNSAQAIAFLQT